MKTLRASFIAIALLMALTGSAFAQTYNATTTLTNAITDRTCNTRTVTVGSTTGWSTGTLFFIDWELFITTGVTNSTQVTATRCQSSTPPQLHSASSVVIWGPASMFQQGDTNGNGQKMVGACTASNYAYLPIVNIKTGNVYLCRAFNSSGVTSAQWTWTNVQNGTYNSLLTKLD